MLAHTARTPAQAERALAIADSLRQRSNNATTDALWRLFAAQAFARAGMAEQARHQLRLVEAQMPASTEIYILPEMAFTRLLLDDREGAVTLLRRALVLKPGIRRWLLAEPQFAALRTVLR